LSLIAFNSSIFIARMIVRRDTFLDWAAWAGDMGVPTGRSLGIVITSPNSFCTKS
jgi:hypothetical protein